MDEHKNDRMSDAILTGTGCAAVFKTLVVIAISVLLMLAVLGAYSLFGG